MLRRCVPAANNGVELNLPESLRWPEIRVVLLDIEGTTTPITFVSQTLFPYARERAEQFLRGNAHRADVRADLDLLHREWAAEKSANPGVPAWNDAAEIASAVRYVHWLIDRDRKSPALKSLQGKIWEHGYRSGELRGEVYPDVAPAMERWRAAGSEVAIFSSGSVLAQKLLFTHSTAGDLTRFISAYFDLGIGPKREAESYARIAAHLVRDPQQILFLSDVDAEITAARAAGMIGALCAREGEASSAGTKKDEFVLRSFDELP